jgi:uncharacterized membrane protein
MIWVVYLTLVLQILFHSTLMFLSKNDEEEGAKETFYVSLVLTALSVSSLFYLLLG